MNIDHLDISYPVRADQTAVYSTVVDAEDRLICFISICFKSGARTKLIAELLNAHHSKDENASAI